jgi:hypothetical protein
MRRREKPGIFSDSTSATINGAHSNQKGRHGGPPLQLILKIADASQVFRQQNSLFELGFQFRPQS